MFCIRCGKEIEEGTKWCPYCGAKCIDSFEKEQEMDDIIKNNREKIKKNKKKRKKPFYKKWWFWMVIGLVGIFLALMFINVNDSGYTFEERKTAPVSWDDVGGFEGWKKTDFAKSVRTDIKVLVPVVAREVNNYAVNIGPIGLNSVLIMQVDETPAKEWKWLMNAEPFETGGEFAYFKATLTYTGITTNDEDKLPVFWISDIESYQDGLSPVSETDSFDDPDILRAYTDDINGVLSINTSESVIEYDSYLTNVAVEINSTINVDIKDGMFGVMAWDESGLPLIIDNEYFYIVEFENLPANGTKEIEFDLMITGVKYLYMIILYYEDYQGDIWTNPATDYLKNNCAGKKYEETNLNAFVYEIVEETKTEEILDYIEPTENQEILEPEIFDFIGVDGIYCDYSNGSDYSDLEVRISNITQNTFDFAIYEYNELIFKHHTAEITSEASGTYYGQQYTLYFTWTDVGTLEINGFEAVEGVSFVNSSYYQVS